MSTSDNPGKQSEQRLFVFSDMLLLVKSKSGWLSSKETHRMRHKWMLQNISIKPAGSPLAFAVMHKVQKGDRTSVSKFVIHCADAVQQAKVLETVVKWKEVPFLVAPHALASATQRERRRASDSQQGGEWRGGGRRR